MIRYFTFTFAVLVIIFLILIAAVIQNIQFISLELIGIVLILIGLLFNLILHDSKQQKTKSDDVLD